MKARTVFLLVILVHLAGSCIPSLFPLYTDDDIVYNDSILGVWDGGDLGNWTVEKMDNKSNSSFFNPGEKKTDETPEDRNYKLIVRQVSGRDTLKTEFALHLLELGDYLYLNISPHDYDLHHGFLSWHMIQANTFMRVRIFENRIEIQAFDPDFLADLIQENKVRINHISLGGFFLTAPTADLQKFVLKYSNEEGVLLEPEVFRKI